MLKNIATGVLVGLIIGILTYAATMLIDIKEENIKAATRDSLIYFNINNVKKSVNDVSATLNDNLIINSEWHEKFLEDKTKDLEFSRKHLIAIELKLNMIKELQEFADYNAIKIVDDTLWSINDSCLVDVCE